MNYGLYISASGVLTNLYRQDVYTNNLANLDTTGFKPSLVTFQQRDAASVEDGLHSLDSNAMLEKLGAGLLLGRNRIDFRQGTLAQTGQALDLAVERDGFFVVSTESGQGVERLGLTRDGRMMLDGDGRLVLAANGMPVLDVSDRPIVLDPNQGVVVQTDGSVVQDGAVIAQIQLTDVPNRRALVKVGDGVFAAPNTEQENRRPATGLIRQGWLEGSGVNPITALMQLSAAGKAAKANATMLKYHDEVMQRAVSRLGRVA
ncbi:MAG: flagellar hook basal-body protein [Phycisphaerales bacterium]|nr:flagellar hook basal-body protein [Phycisphaerales bacterium]